ncbi:MAG: hypothetical protein OXF85_02915 [Candidatus Saccharibacteria bacterium]|nr:hypothetical protein [Candidatus Saccharibacteria bacterium]MCY4088980.1 hypothetical protein [Candidatus Saccharibacteria bacterium]
MNKYKFREEDIQIILEHLDKNDPQNATREYVLQLLEIFQEFAKTLAKKDPRLAEEFYKSLLENQKITEENDDIE